MPLFTYVFEGNLNAVVVEFLVFGPELITATGAANKKLDDRWYRRVGGKFHPRCTADVRKTVEIVIDNIVKQLADVYSLHGLIADPQHLRPRSQCGNMLVAPSHFVIDTQACNCFAASVELYILSSSDITLEPFRIRHFDRRNAGNHPPDLFALRGDYRGESKS